MASRFVGLVCLLFCSIVVGEDFVGFPTVGINQYRGEIIYDFTAVTNANWLTEANVVYEVGQLNPSGNVSTFAVPGTPGTSEMATTRHLIYNFYNLMGLDTSQYDSVEFNKPIYSADTMHIRSRTAVDRKVVRQLGSTGKCGLFEYCYPNAFLPRPNLDQWEAVKGLVSITCGGTAGARTADLSVTMKDGNPKGIYSLWIVGGDNVKTSNERMVAGPLGGFGNYIYTDASGCGYFRRSLSYCPLDGCDVGSWCHFYISLFYHPDFGLYGGSPALSYFTPGAAAGAIGTNHLLFTFNPKIPKKSSREFTRLEYHGCGAPPPVAPTTSCN